jgi:hypothetical protein
MMIVVPLENPSHRDMAEVLVISETIVSVKLTHARKSLAEPREVAHAS